MSREIFLRRSETIDTRAVIDVHAVEVKSDGFSGRKRRKEGWGMRI